MAVAGLISSHIQNGVQRALLLGVAALCACGLLAAAPAAAGADTVRVLLMVVDGQQLVPRSLTHFENNQVTVTPWSDVSTIHHFAFERSTSMGALYQEMSFGQATLDGDTVSISLPYAASAYSWTQWANFADAAAEGLGYDLSQYDRFLYILPYLPKNAPGIGSASGNRGWCAYLTTVELGCIFHELGHTFAMTHASEVWPNGTIVTRADQSDGLMGSGSNSHVNAINKYLAGWLTGSRLQLFDTTGTSGFVLAPQSAAPDVPQVVRIVNNGARPVNGVVDTYLSYRDTGGFDAQLLSSGADLNGDAVHDAVLVQQWYRYHGGDTLHVKSLGTGDVYSENGVTVSVDDISGGNATVTVTRDPYYPVAPLTSTVPANIDSQPWLSAYYTLSITNQNDPAQVPFDSFYDVTFNAPGPGWAQGWTNSLPKTVPPGQTRSFYFWVKPPGSSPLGSYGFTLTATDPDGDSGPVQDQASATYTVVGPLDSTPPSTPTGLTGSIEVDSVLLTWNPSTDDLSGVARYEILRSVGGAAFEMIGTASWIAYLDATAVQGPLYQYKVRAVDQAGNVSATSNVFSVPAAGGSRCGFGFELAFLLPPLWWWRQSSRRRPAVSARSAGSRKSSATAATSTARAENSPK